MRPITRFPGWRPAALLLAIVAGSVAAVHDPAQEPAGHPAQSSVTTADPFGNPCDSMANMAGMNVMGESMAAMANHMCITPDAACAAGR